MAQCQAITRGGVRCRNEALPGSNYCRVHQRREPTPMRPMVLGGETRRVRYLGRAPFLAGPVTFSPSQPVAELPMDQALYLTGKLPGLFRLEE